MLMDEHGIWLAGFAVGQSEAMLEIVLFVDSDF